MADWSITYRVSGPTELRFKGEIIAIGGSAERHALLASIAQTMNAEALRGRYGARSLPEKEESMQHVPARDPENG